MHSGAELGAGGNTSKKKIQAESLPTWVPLWAGPEAEVALVGTCPVVAQPSGCAAPAESGPAPNIWHRGARRGRHAGLASDPAQPQANCGRQGEATSQGYRGDKGER